MQSLIRWFEDHQLDCFYKSMLGMDCPGCGTQRAFVLLLKGEWMDSLHTYPPLMMFLFLFLFLSLHLLFKFRNGGVWLKYLFIATAASVLINFIFSLIVRS